ncbi:Emopamil-binding protein [Sanghuangporus baumii]|uniref:Emopamil-binding protein n=1 Tax=Sanghuangporus baumii TaxID=108892 RepID=A0A9Q5I1X4_SANBA|nr:Emopamil-binding protein [Sanghuangporus baumii]
MSGTVESMLRGQLQGRNGTRDVRVANDFHENVCLLFGGGRDDWIRREDSSGHSPSQIGAMAGQVHFHMARKEYARADFRWGFSDPTVVSLEILTVLGAGPLCCYILYQLVRQDPARHYWIVVLSTAELYGGWMTFCPEWLTGSPNLDTSNPLYLWVYLVFMNVIWVFIPLWLMFDSYSYIASSLRFSQTNAAAKKK